MRAAVLLGAAVRLGLAWLGIGRELAWRPEICTAANSNLELREGLALARLGVSPYSGSSCRVPPLALWLQSPLADHDFLYVLPNILADVLTALLLYSLVQKLIARSTAAQQARRSARAAAAAAGSTPQQVQSSVLPTALAWCYLLNPLSLLPSVAGTTSPLESLAVVSALYGSCTASYGMAAAGLVAAVYMSPHAGVLTLAACCLLAYGPEDAMADVVALSGRGERPPAAEGAAQEQGAQGEGRAGGAAAAAGEQPPSKTTHPPASADGQKGGRGQAAPAASAVRRRGSPQQQQQQPSPPQPPPHKHSPEGKAESSSDAHDRGLSGPSAPLFPWRSFRKLAGLLLSFLLLLVLLSDLYLTVLTASAASVQHSSNPNAVQPDPGGGTCLLSTANTLLLHPPWPSLTELLAAPAASADPPDRHRSTSPPPSSSASSQLAALLTHTAAVLGRVQEQLAVRGLAVRQSLYGCWAARVYSSHVLLDDVTPNVGQWWYLALEAFEDTKPYLRLLAPSLLFALAPALALRLGPRRPLALFLIQLLAVAALKPYPSIADMGLATSLLLLLWRQQLALFRLWLLLPAGLVLLCVLGPAMLHMWLSYESANSNFFYSITLVYGVWQVLLMGQVLGLTLRVDRMLRGKD